MKKEPLITIIITAYNYGQYIKKAIDSAVNQNYKNIEIIIINDGSTDNSDEIIKKAIFGKDRIRYISRKNLGANITRNEGIDLANGELFFFLDADNWLNPDHISTLYKTMVKHNADVVYANLQHFGEDKQLCDVIDFDLDILKVTNFIDTSALIKKKSIGDNRFDLWLNRKFSQDWDFFLGLALKGLVIVKNPKAQLNYRVHNKQHGGHFRTVEKIDTHMEVYYHITQKYAKQYPKQFGSLTKWTNSLVLQYAAEKKATLKKTIELNETKQQLEAILNSKSFKIGRAITAPFRVARNSIKPKK